MNPNEYCSDVVTRDGGDFRYSLLGLPLQHRQTLIAIQAFCLETTRIPYECRDPTVARAKLDWWRAELGRLLAGVPEHPVTRALQPCLTVFNLPGEYFWEILDGVAMDLDGHTYPGFTELALYLHRQGSVPALLAANVTGYRERRATPRFAHEGGIFLKLFDLLYAVREHARLGYCYLPEAEMRQFGVNPGDLLAAQTSERVRELFAFQTERLCHYYQRALELLPAADCPTQTPLLIRMELTMTLLQEIANEDYRLLEQRTYLTPLRKLWLAWRGQRRCRRGGLQVKQQS